MWPRPFGGGSVRRGCVRLVHREAALEGPFALLLGRGPRLLDGDGRIRDLERLAGGVTDGVRAGSALPIPQRVLRLRARRAAAVFRFLVAAAFLPAATRFVDLRAVDLRAVDFLAVDLRAVVLRVDFLAGAAFRFRVAAAFFPAATRFVDLRAVDSLAVDVVAVGPRPGVRLLPVGPLLGGAGPASVGCMGVGVAVSIGPPTPDGVLFERGTGRSHAGVSGRQDGSGASDASRPCSSASRLGSDLPVSFSLLSLPGHSCGSRSDDGMCALPPRVGVIFPLPERARNEA